MFCLGLGAFLEFWLGEEGLALKVSAHKPQPQELTKQESVELYMGELCSCIGFRV